MDNLLQQFCSKQMRKVLEYKEEKLTNVLCKLWNVDPFDLIDVAHEHKCEMLIRQNCEYIRVDGKILGRFVIDYCSDVSIIRWESVDDLNPWVPELLKGQ